MGASKVLIIGAGKNLVGCCVVEGRCIMELGLGWGVESWVDRVKKVIWVGKLGWVKQGG